MFVVTKREKETNVEELKALFIATKLRRTFDTFSCFDIEKNRVMQWEEAFEVAAADHGCVNEGSLNIL